MLQANAAPFAAPAWALEPGTQQGNGNLSEAGLPAPGTFGAIGSSMYLPQLGLWGTLCDWRQCCSRYCAGRACLQPITWSTQSV